MNNKKTMADLGCLESSDDDAAADFTDTASELQASLLKSMGADSECKTATAGGCSIGFGGCAGASASSGCQALNASIQTLANVTNTVACTITSAEQSSESKILNNLTIKFINYGITSVDGDVVIGGDQTATINVDIGAAQEAVTQKMSDIQTAIASAVSQTTTDEGGFLSGDSATKAVQSLVSYTEQNTTLEDITSSVQQMLNDIEQNQTIEIENHGTIDVGGNLNIGGTQSASIVAQMIVQQAVDSVMDSSAGIDFTSEVTSALESSNSGIESMAGLLTGILLPLLIIGAAVALFMFGGPTAVFKWLPFILLGAGILMIILAASLGMNWIFYLVASGLIVAGIIMIVVKMKK